MGGEPAQPVSYASKAEMAKYVLSQLDAVVAPMPSSSPTVNLMIALGNVSSLLFYAYNALADPEAKLQHLPVNWVGFYLMTGHDAMALGPFQGRVACTKIKVGRGVCGTAVLQNKTLVVPDVHQFPGHIACDGDSNSEIVVPIHALASDRRVVGVLDIDSTVVGQFDEEDAALLEKVVRALGERLEFPFRPPVIPLGQADEPPAHRRQAPAVSKFSSSIAALQHAPPEIQTQEFHGWEVQRTELQRIQSQQEQAELEKHLNIHAIPEIVFTANSLRLVHIASHTALHFDAYRVLESAAQWYRSDEYRNVFLSEDRLAVPCSDTWKQQQRFDVFDARIDWAWRHRFFGVSHGENASNAMNDLEVVRDDAAQLDWDLLKRTDVPILGFGALTLLEDDLHDNGLVLCTLKYRVMDACFFVLLRHVVHVHGSGVSIRDVRVFHKFGQERDGFPYIVLEEQERRQVFEGSSSTPAANWNHETADALAATVPVAKTTHFTIVRKNPS